MKKLAFLVTMVFLTAVSSNVFGQSTSGTAPAPGATHTYSVINTPGSSYTWKVYKGNSSTEVDDTDIGIASITPSGNSVTIEWATTAVVGAEYLIVVEEEDSNTCKNSKALPVEITSVFDLIASAPSASACYNNSVSVSWNGGVGTGDVNYDHGDATIVYTVTPSGVGASETWSFEPTFNLGTNFSQTSLTVSGASTGTVTADGNGDYTFTGTEVVTVTIVVDNQNTYDNSSAVDAQDFDLTMTLTDVAVNSGAIETDSTNNESTVSVTRPNTSGISAN